MPTRTLPGLALGKWRLQSHANTTPRRWDDWVPQERLRKFTDENKELASNLKKDMDAQRRAASKPLTVQSSKKRVLGSDLASSARGSEDRSSVAPQAPRGTKRGRDVEGIDKVSLRIFYLAAGCFFGVSLSAFWVQPRVCTVRHFSRGAGCHSGATLGSCAATAVYSRVLLRRLVFPCPRSFSCQERKVPARRRTR
jgi:hypothetical protein